MELDQEGVPNINFFLLNDNKGTISDDSTFQIRRAELFLDC